MDEQQHGVNTTGDKQPQAGPATNARQVRHGKGKDKSHPSTGDSGEANGSQPPASDVTGNHRQGSNNRADQRKCHACGKRGHIRA
eukprot:scaffold465849_cov45-Prasinocladus_malaysianus.AAC.1